MKERPILFSGEMVRAILDGRKTQTRRVVKPQPVGEWAAPGRTACPYGVPGDRLWVRETWQEVYERSDGQRSTRVQMGYHYKRGWIEYAATPGDEPPPKWRPSIFMPRDHSRITLEVTAVRVERLQEIDYRGAVAEGIEPTFPEVDRGTFATLWDTINARRGFPWDSNPWVWVVAFKVT